ncbi:hypothetical protein BDC45DRAFT_515759, partial [Circinella umbellata]
LPIKSETYDQRDQYVTSKFKEAKELYKSRGIKNKDFIAAAKSAVRFTSDIKTAIIEKTYQRFDLLADFLPAVYYYQAPYESDGMIIKLASIDLLVYKGCLDVMRIMEIKWDTPSLALSNQQPNYVPNVTFFRSLISSTKTIVFLIWLKSAS